MCVETLSAVARAYHFHASLCNTVSSFVIKQQNLSSEAKNIRLVLEGNKGYVLKGSFIRDSLSASFINRNKSNILGYFTEWNAFRGIAMAICEGISHTPDFKDYLKRILGEDKQKHFEYIIRFIRNVLSHNIESEINLIADNFEGTKKQFIRSVDQSGVARFDFNYNRDFPAKTGFPEDYGFYIEIRFCDLKAGNKFTNVVSEWHLFMIMELCYNLVNYYRKVSGCYSTP